MSKQAMQKEQLTAYQRWELDSFDAPKEVPLGGAPKVSIPPEGKVPLAGAPTPERSAVILPTAAQLERVQQQAQQEGYAAGYREGSARAAAEAARLHEIAAALTQESQQFDQRLAEDLLALALAVAKQVLRQALALRPELILAVINEVLGQAAQAQRRAQLQLHPEDAALVRASLAEQLARAGCEIVEDAALTRGGCRLRTADCDIDSTLERRWQRVVAAIGNEHAWIE